MRKDMSKIIVERPRFGRGAANRRPGRTRVVVDDDGDPIHALRGGRAPTREKPEKTKSLNENLAPLRRYLESQIGRPWDKVYSEISEHLKPTSTVQQHVRDHLEDFVAVRTRMRAGKVMVVWRWGGETPLEEATWKRLYVHPRTGLLCQNKHWQGSNARARARRKREESERAARMRVIDDKTQLHLFDGVWWEVKLAKIPRVRRTDALGRVSYEYDDRKDVVRMAGLSTLSLDSLYARWGVYAVDKRIVPKAEKKKLGLC